MYSCVYLLCLHENFVNNATTTKQPLLKAIKILLERGANVNLKSKYVSIRNGYLQINVSVMSEHVKSCQNHR